jgi:integrase
VEKHIIRPLGEMAVGEITPLSIAVWIDGLRDNGLSETTIYLVFSHLSGILDFAVEEDIIPRNPCRGRAVREAKPKKTRRPAAFVSVTGAQSNAIRSHLPERYRATVDLGRGLGLRQGEIFGFSPDDIDWKTKTIHIQRQIACDRGRMVLAPPKCSDVYGIRDRWIPAADEVLFRLIAHATEFPPVSVTLPWASRHGEPRTVLLMFATPDHQPINKSDFNPLWKSALEAAGIIRAINDEHRGGGRRWEECRDKIMHALRHLYASERLAEGMDVAILALRLGHIDPAYTLRSYAHQVTDDHQEERERIDKTLRGTRVPRSAPDVQL